ncbi:MAG: hypothetical protein K8R59_14330 [Thermoanaerobaculales bacterium]|nr:hypothetical protein [Thermoanaerobaculales bacterium]
MSDFDPEIEFLRAVEDLFTTLRGVPHILSPKDVHLVRDWWKTQVPLTAVNAGLTEVIDRRRKAGEIDPVVSLSYCRHAVKRHARRLAEQRLGAAADDRGVQQTTEPIDLGPLTAQLRDAAKNCHDEHPRAGHIIATIADHLQGLEDLNPTEVDERLYTLEAALLDGCRRCLPKPLQDQLRTSAASAAADSGAVGAAMERAKTAFFDRSLRDLFGLPRLEAP